MTNTHNSKILDQFGQQAEKYARLARSSTATQRQPQGVALLQPGADDTLLDVACGTGRLTLEMARHVRSATGIDLTPAMLKQAREAQAAAGIENVTWQQADVQTLPLPDNSFTLVTCSAAFHHFETPLAVLREMARVCAPSGRVMVLDVTPPAEKAQEFDRIETLRDPSHARALTLEELKAAGSEVGLMPLREVSWATPLSAQALVDASFPEALSREELLEMYQQDLDSGADRYGLTPCYQEENLAVCFPMSAVVWEKPSH